MNKYVLLWNINSFFIIQCPSKKLNIWGSRSKRSDDWVAQFNGAHNKCRFDLDRTTETTSFYKKVVWPSHGSIFHFGCHRSENNKTFFSKKQEKSFWGSRSWWNTSTCKPLSSVNGRLNKIEMACDNKRMKTNNLKLSFAPFLPFLRMYRFFNPSLHLFRVLFNLCLLTRSFKNCN